MSKSEEYFAREISAMDYPNVNDTIKYGQICKLEGKIELLKTFLISPQSLLAEKISDYEKELEKIIQG